MSSSRAAFPFRLPACLVASLLAVPARASAATWLPTTLAQTELNIAWGNYIGDILLVAALAALAGLAVFVICRSSRRV